MGWADDELAICDDEDSGSSPPSEDRRPEWRDEEERNGLDEEDFESALEGSDELEEEILADELFAEDSTSEDDEISFWKLEELIESMRLLLDPIAPLQDDEDSGLSPSGEDWCPK